MTTQDKPSIFSLTPSEIEIFMSSIGEPKFRSKQFCKWIFEDRVFDVEQMTNFSKNLREKLQQSLNWSRPEIINQLESGDGTTKLLLKGEKNQLIETVIMRYDNRTSLCVSSQVGCKLACSFCQTGKLGFFRNLTTAEIVTQFAIANDIVKPEGRRISNIVFMGMGEPLDNFDNLLKSVNLFTGEDTYNLSSRKVTVSTSGLPEKINRLADEANIALAISLHSADDDLRSELMPINRKFNLEKLKSALMYYQKKTNDKITLEYILIKDKNCGLKDAKALVKFIHGLRVKVNLIPFNPHPGLEYDRPSDEDIRNFQKYLADRSLPAPVRYSRGQEVSAACGQLAAKSIETLNQKPNRKDAVIKE